MKSSRKDRWLSEAIDYVSSWIELQVRASAQPGCVVAIALKDRILLDQAFGVADLSTGEKLTPRHRFRVASHSKSFTAAGVMKLREQGRLKLDDPVGDYVASLNSSIARATIGQILSHSAGITRHWRNAHAAGEEYYGLGIISGALNGWDWFGHSGGLPGYISRTAVLPEQDLTISVLTNASNGWAGPWVDGAIHILREFSQRGPPTPKVRGWTGRWWSQGGPGDYIPLGNRFIVANLQAWNPFLNATEIEVTGRDKGRVSLDNGYGNHGEAIARRRNKAGKVVELLFAGYKLLPEDALAAEMRERYRLVGSERERRSSHKRRRRRP